MISNSAMNEEYKAACIFYRHVSQDSTVLSKWRIYNYKGTQLAPRGQDVLLGKQNRFFFLKGELQPKISLLNMKVLTLIKAKSNVFLWYVQWRIAREERKPKYWRLGRRHLGLSLTLWRHIVKRDILNMNCDCWFMFLRLLISCKSQKNRLRVSRNRFK